MAAIYTSSFLRSLSSSIQTNNRLAPDLWQRLTSLGLSRVKPTRRGLRGGNRRRQVLPRPGTVLESSMGQPLSSYGSFLADFPGEKVNLNGESNLHTAPSSTLNIQIDTLQRVGINNGSILVIKPRNRLRDGGKTFHVLPLQFHRIRGKKAQCLALLHYSLTPCH